MCVFGGNTHSGHLGKKEEMKKKKGIVFLFLSLEVLERESEGFCGFRDSPYDVDKSFFFDFFM